MTYRSPEQRRAILRSIQAGASSAELGGFSLTAADEGRYRRAIVDAERRAVRKLSPFSRYRSLRIAKPFTVVPMLVIVIAIACGVADCMLLRKADLAEANTYPLFAAAATIAAIAVAAVGWGIGGWVAHRNARVQHTINIVATRFSQPAFVNHLATFNTAFGDGAYPLVTKAMIDDLAASQDPKDHGPVQSLRYILNYFEFISQGIERGDLDLPLIEKNLRGNMRYYFDKCGPYIAAIKLEWPLALEAYTRVRDYFEEV